MILGSDHGEAFLEHGLTLHVHTLYDELLKVPLLVHAPGRLPTGRRVSSQVRNLDILPTMLDLAGLAIPAGLRGETLLPLARGVETADRVAFAHTDGTSHEKHYTSKIPGLDRSLFEVHVTRRANDHKVFNSLLTDRTEIYHLERDPGERHNSAGAELEIDRRLKQALLEWVAKQSKNAPKGKRIHLEPRDLERLRSLGYLL